MNNAKDVLAEFLSTTKTMLFTDRVDALFNRLVQGVKSVGGVLNRLADDIFDKVGVLRSKSCSNPTKLSIRWKSACPYYGRQGLKIQRKF